MFCNISGDIMTFKVDGKIEPFRATGHYPLLIGYDARGEALYLAQIWNNGCCYGLVRDGESTATFTDTQGETIVVNSFDVVVLRYDPCGKHSNYASTIDGALDSTGPLHWRRYWPQKDPALLTLINNMRNELGDWQKNSLDNLVSEFDKIFYASSTDEIFKSNDAFRLVTPKRKRIDFSPKVLYVNIFPIRFHYIPGLNVL